MMMMIMRLIITKMIVKITIRIVTIILIIITITMMTIKMTMMIMKIKIIPTMTETTITRINIRKTMKTNKLITDQVILCKNIFRQHPGTMKSEKNLPG